MFNLYETSNYAKHFSIDDAMTNPISAPPEYTYTEGESNDFHVYARNDSDRKLTNLQVSVVDTDDYASSVNWIKLADVQVGLSGGGQTLSLPDSNSGDTDDFWVRITPTSTAVGNYRNLKLKIEYKLG